MTRIYLIRHGDAYDEEGLQLEDYPLNNYGKVQALQLARRLKDNKFQAMYCSKIRRSMETCEAVNEIHKHDVVYDSAFNEVGSVDWPQPGDTARAEITESIKSASEHIHKTFKKVAQDHKDEEVIIFTHGNWIRVLLATILNPKDVSVFCHFVIHNTSLNIIDVDEEGYEYIIGVSDSAHTHLYESRI